ncbi:unnamed protein product [Discula destructiva]
MAVDLSGPVWGPAGMAFGAACLVAAVVGIWLACRWARQHLDHQQQQLQEQQQQKQQQSSFAGALGALLERGGPIVTMRDLEMAKIGAELAERQLTTGVVSVAGAAMTTGQGGVEGQPRQRQASGQTAGPADD